MSLLKCKCCGGDLNIKDGDKVVTCPYCGAQQTIPNEKDEQVLKIYARGNRLRSQGEFDKAYSTYSQLLNEGKENAEVYWNLLLCKYGITYVDDYDGKKKPTMNRRSMTSILDDDDYKKAIELSDSVSKEVYEQEANRINDIQKGILKIVHQEEPYDVFISYKETDEFGDRTKDSLLAQEIYDALTKDGYRVFLSRVTLSNVIGKEYEPYIYSALYTAKLMLLVTTEEEHVNSIWVKNEWSRFVDRRKTDSSKNLIPCYRDRDPYDLPKELRNLQGLDRGKLGFIQDLKRGVEKILGKKQDKLLRQRMSNLEEPEIENDDDKIEEKKYNERIALCAQLVESKKYDQLKTVLVQLKSEEYQVWCFRDWKFNYYSLQNKLHVQSELVSFDDADYVKFLRKCPDVKIKSDIERKVYTAWINDYCSKCNKLTKKMKDIIDPGYSIRNNDFLTWHQEAQKLHKEIKTLFDEIKKDECSVYKDLFYSRDQSLPFRPYEDKKEYAWNISDYYNYVHTDLKRIFIDSSVIGDFNEDDIDSLTNDINITSIKAIYLEKKIAIIVADKIYLIHSKLDICEYSGIYKERLFLTSFFHCLKQKIFDYYFILDDKEVFDYQDNRLAPQEAKKIQEIADGYKNNLLREKIKREEAIASQQRNSNIAVKIGIGIFLIAVLGLFVACAVTCSI